MIQEFTYRGATVLTYEAMQPFTPVEMKQQRREEREFKTWQKNIRAMQENGTLDAHLAGLRLALKK